MTTIERSTAIGVFEDRISAEQALEDLRNAGFSDDTIGFAVRDMNTTATSPETIERETATGAATGAVSGVVVGGLVGAAAALLIPGLGPALAGGILAATLGGAALGAVAGSFAGALAGFGISEEDALYYQNELEMGRTIVTVKSLERYQEAFDILHRYGAYDINTRSIIQNVPIYNSETPASNDNNSDMPISDDDDQDATAKSSAIAAPKEYVSEQDQITSLREP